MHLYDRVEDYTPNREPIILTIGNFDGMHRGHRAVLKRARELAGSEGQLLVITFRNHPSEVLKPEQPSKLLCSFAHKLLLLQQFGVDELLLLTFTRHLAHHSAVSFIEHLRQYIPFSFLVLGYDATLGRDKQGDRNMMLKLGEEWGFHVDYLSEYRYEGKPVSSTRIREALQQGDLVQVEELLGRPFSIYSTVEAGKKRIDLTGLCLPPEGEYEVQIQSERPPISGIASLQNQPSPSLELHLLEEVTLLDGQSIEILFKSFVHT